MVSPAGFVLGQRSAKDQRDVRHRSRGVGEVGDGGANLILGSGPGGLVGPGAGLLALGPGLDRGADDATIGQSG
jgi:hypothetical protein